MQLALGKVSNPSMYHRYFGTPLAAAARGNQLEAVALLLKRGAQLTVPRGYGNDEGPRLNRTPLTVACLKGYTAVVLLLLEHRDSLPRLKLETRDRTNALSQPRFNFPQRNPRFYPYPHRFPSQPQQAYPEDYFEAAVDAAFRGRSLFLVHLLLTCGFLPLKDSLEMVFYLAADHRSVEMIDLISTSEFDPKDYFHYNGRRRYPIAGAAKKNRVTVISRLVELGCAETPDECMSAYQLAIMRGSTEAIRALPFDPFTVFGKLYDGVTASHSFSLTATKSPLQLALRNQQEDMLEYLLGLDIPKDPIEADLILMLQRAEVLNTWTLTALCHEGRNECVRILLEAGADPNGNKALDEAIDKYWSKRPADINHIKIRQSYAEKRYEDNVFVPPLCIATAKKNIELANLLTRFGARVFDPYLVNEDPYTEQMKALQPFTTHMDAIHIRDHNQNILKQQKILSREVELSRSLGHIFHSQEENETLSYGKLRLGSLSLVDQ